MAVVTLEDVQPIARYDALPWTQARIEEATTEDGTWVALETIAIDFGPNPPADPDPSEPAVRSFTTQLATDDPGLWYRIVFLDADADESTPTDPVQNGTANTLYVTVQDLKRSVNVNGESFLNEECLMACEAASRVCDTAKRTRFYPTTETRYYTAGAYDTELTIDDINTVTSITVDRDGNGTYEETWVAGTNYVLDPANAQLEGRPFNQISLLPGTTFPAYTRSVKVVGSFGWTEAPAVVREAAMILARRLVGRKDVPFGILVAGQEMIAAARLGRIDPDVQMLLDNVPGTSTGGLRSLQLG